MQFFIETASLLPINIIKERKVLFYFHLINLNPKSLAHQVYKEQRRLRLPGFVREVQEILAELNIREGTAHSTTKAQFRTIVKSAIKIKNDHDILELSKRYKKVNFFKLKEEGIQMKSYIKDMDLKSARTLFAYNSEVMCHIKLNQMSHEPFSKANWVCHECTSISSSIHVKWCPGYAHLRENLSLDKDDDLIWYLSQVIKIRTEADKERM